MWRRPDSSLVGDNKTKKQDAVTTHEKLHGEWGREKRSLGEHNKGITEEEEGAQKGILTSALVEAYKLRRDSHI